MNCRTAGNLLSAFLDRELSPDRHRSVEQHLRDCSRCALELEDLSRQHELLGSILGRPLPVPDAPVPLPARSARRSRFPALGDLVRRGKLALAGASVVAASFLGWTATRPPTLHVARVVGHPSVVSRGVEQDLRPGRALGVGDRVATAAGEKVEIQWPDGTRALLSPKGEARLLADNRGLRLTRGALWVDVAKQKVGFRVEGPAATAEVLGTQFMVTTNAQGVTRLAVWRGRVRFGNPKGAVIATAWKQTVALPGSAPAPVWTYSPLGSDSLWWLD